MIGKILHWFKLTFSSNRIEETIIPKSNVNSFLPEEIFFPILIKSNGEVGNNYWFRNSNLRVGISEVKFHEYLVEEFGSKISNNISLKFKDKSFEFDFAYMSDNLFINIEIDEPYTIVENSIKPIHFVGKDDERNRIVCESGWNVLRFSEEQIVKNPLECIEYIKNYINNNSSLIEFSKQKQWTKDEAILLSEDKYREEYLGQELIDGQNVQKEVMQVFRIRISLGKGEYKGCVFITLYNERESFKSIISFDQFLLNFTSYNNKFDSYDEFVNFYNLNLRSWRLLSTYGYFFGKIKITDSSKNFAKILSVKIKYSNEFINVFLKTYLDELKLNIPKINEIQALESILKKLGIDKDSINWQFLISNCKDL